MAEAESRTTKTDRKAAEKMAAAGGRRVAGRGGSAAVRIREKKKTREDLAGEKWVFWHSGHVTLDIPHTANAS